MLLAPMIGVIDRCVMARPPLQDLPDMQAACVGPNETIATTVRAQTAGSLTAK